MTTLRVLAPGALTTVQDAGRPGWRHLGVSVGGALDPLQARLANRLVGNPDDAAVLELTMTGPTLAFDRPLRIALCGARTEMRFEGARDGTRVAVPHGRPVALPPGTLRIGTLRTGLRAWLAIGGGIAVPPVLGGRGTDLRGGFGGFAGRALRRDDELELGPHTTPAVVSPTHPAWWIDLDADIATNAPIRVVPTDAQACAALLARTWRVDPRSDRQGLRCAGMPLTCEPRDRLSAPVAPGTIQLPPDGQPIVLLADAQTIGGYPRLGDVITADLWRLAQLRAGDTLRFATTNVADAARLRRQRQAALARATIMIEAVGATPGAPFEANRAHGKNGAPTDPQHA